MANAFYIQEEWITDYKLSGNDLLIFARLASFTLNVGGYNGSVEWLGHSVGISRRATVDIIVKLEKRGLIVRGDKFTKCVFQPFTSGENSTQKCAETAQKSAKIACAEIAQKSAESAKKSAESAHKYNKENNYTNKCSNSVIVEANTHTLTHTENFLFDFFKSKIANEMDESCIRNLAKKFSNIEQAKLFAEFCEERKTTLNLGMLCKLHGEIFDKACEWDATGRPRKQPEQPPQPQPQMLPQQRIPENSANEAQNSGFSQWMAQVIDVIKNHPKFAKKSRLKDYSIALQVTNQFPTPCDLEKINEYLNAI